MKRIYVTLLFAAAILTWVTLDMGATTPALRIGLLAAIVALALWKAVDFWKRHSESPLSSEDSETS
jgi:hypothetical protein